MSLNPIRLGAVRDWSVGAIAAVSLHAACGVGLAALSLLNAHENLQRPELAIELDMQAAIDAAAAQGITGGGGGAGGAIASPTPITEPQPHVAPYIPPDLIEPVEGAPAAGSDPNAPLPLGYGAGYGGGMGGGIGGGIGNGVGNGVGDGAETPTLDRARLRRYIQTVRERIAENIVYPDQALRHRSQGLAALLITIDRSGQIVAFSFRTPTDIPALNDAIEDAVRRVGRLPPLPTDFPHDRMRFGVNVRFMLCGEAGGPACDDQEEAPPAAP